MPPPNPESNVAERLAAEDLLEAWNLLVPEDRFDSLFARVMSLVPPEELQAILGGRPQAPLSSEEEGLLRDLVSKGFRDWREFHERYSGERCDLPVFYGDRAEMERQGPTIDPAEIIVPRAMEKMLHDADEDALARVTQTFLPMKKLDLAKLEKAYEAP